MDEENTFIGIFYFFLAALRMFDKTAKKLFTSFNKLQTIFFFNFHQAHYLALNTQKINVTKINNEKNKL